MRGIRTSGHGRFLVEFLITLIIFTTTSTIMFQLFVQGSEISASAYDLNRAVVRAESITEQVLASGGDEDALPGQFVRTTGGFGLYLDGDWKETDAAGGKYYAEISLRTADKMLYSDVAIKQGDKEIYSLHAERYIGIVDDEHADG